MCVKLKPWAQKYIVYEDSNDNFWVHLRMNYEWNEEKYQDMLQIIKGMLEEYQQEVVFPKDAIYFFSSTVDFIIGIVSNPYFLKNIPKGFSADSYMDFLETRKAELIDLKNEILFGKF
ncbi:MAG: hypothetical protein RLZZ165_388 [Bacteroidota bacterium]